jgi:uncharacterized damage-inducible protein DinB
MDLERIFVDYSSRKLRQLEQRIAGCLDRLSYEQTWARGGDEQNSIGNLVLHLCGNIKQWIGSGIAGEPDTRVRDAEFAARGDHQPAELKERLTAGVSAAAAIIESLTAERLREVIRVQKYELTVLEGIYHVVEHFAQHTGQIIFATKLLTSSDMGFYGHLKKPDAHGQRTP